MPPMDRYASFMLRLQWMPNDNHPVWIASTQSTRTGELRRFPNLDALIQFLREEFGDAARTVREANREVAEEAKDAERESEGAQECNNAESNVPETKDYHRPTGEQALPRGREPAKE